MTPILVTLILALVATGIVTPIAVSALGLQPPHNKTLHATARAVAVRMLVLDFIVFGCSGRA